jgi:hypothetical protein
MADISVSDDGFINALHNIKKGTVVGELDRELMNAVQAIMDNGGKASITLKIDISRIKNLDSAVTLKPSITVKLPKGEQPEQAMFVTGSCGLVSQNQEQLGFDMRPAGTKVPGGELRKAENNNVTPLNPASR